LLCRRGVGKIFGEKFVAFFVDVGEDIEEILALVLVSTLGEDDVDEFVDASGFCARGVRFRNDLIDHSDDGGVLMGIEGAERVALWRMRTAEKCEEIGAERRQCCARRKKS